MKKIICVISGPTASGKTSTSIKLAKKFGGVIVNFDSLVFYKELTIGTAKPTKEEQEGIPHYFVGTQSIKDPMNAADYASAAIELINELHQKEKIVFLVGGSGFYLQAVLKGMYDSKTTPQNILDRSNLVYEQEGISPFIKELKKNDQESLNQYHENDHYRIRRAVEHLWANGTKFSTEREKMKLKAPDSPVQKFNWNVFHAHLDLDKEQHFEIIQERTKQMISSGLIKEVKDLLNLGYSGEEKPLKSIGYKETMAFINGEFESQDALEQRISISTRQLAKSQRTWFKKVEKSTYNPLLDTTKLSDDLQHFINSLVE